MLWHLFVIFQVHQSSQIMATATACTAVVNQLTSQAGTPQPPSQLDSTLSECCPWSIPMTYPPSCVATPIIGTKTNSPVISGPQPWQNQWVHPPDQRVYWPSLIYYYVLVKVQIHPQKKLMKILKFQIHLKFMGWCRSIKMMKSLVRKWGS